MALRKLSVARRIASTEHGPTWQAQACGHRGAHCYSASPRGNNSPPRSRFQDCQNAVSRRALNAQVSHQREDCRCTGLSVSAVVAYQSQVANRLRRSGKTRLQKGDFRKTFEVPRGASPDRPGPGCSHAR